MFIRFYLQTQKVLAIVIAFVFVVGSHVLPVYGAGTRYALLIGVNEYDNAGNEKRAKEAKRPYFELQKLSYCCNDMIALGSALVTSKYAPQENITILTSNSGNKDNKAILQNINRELKYLLGKLQPNDTVFIAFAGHGLSLPEYKGDDKSELYLCPMDAEIVCDPQTGKFDHRSLLCRKQLELQLENSKASIKILVMDACRNNGLKTRSLNSNLMTQPILNEINKIKNFASPEVTSIAGMFQLFSCGTGETAAESPDLKHGIYSYFMIEGLKGSADDNGNGIITLAELQKYVKKKTIDHAQGVLHHRQAPKITTNGDCTAEEVLIAECTPQSPVQNVQSTPVATAQPNPTTPVQQSNNLPATNSSNVNYNNYANNYNPPQTPSNTNYNNYANNSNSSQTPLNTNYNNYANNDANNYNSSQNLPNTNYNNYANNYANNYNSPQNSANMNYNNNIGNYGSNISNNNYAGNYGNNFSGGNYGGNSYGGGSSYGSSGGFSGGGNSGHRNTR
ncbi:MAG: hypothetical protein LBC02_12690 [Planctomycetaceae bacterium]|jgi:uncharacterized caspase-like protein|nr:hypothetical protein [Planctomycetaceae bacterium]